MKSVILWLLLLGVLAACAYWNLRENKRIIKEWGEILAADSTKWISRLLKSRTWQLLGILSCYTLLLIIYDWQLNSARIAISEFEKLEAEKIEIAKQTITPQLPEDPTLPQANGGVPVKTATTPMQDVYNPEEHEADNEPALDNLKKRFEEILVTHFFLRKCNIASPVDYHIIMSALSQEMASINAPGRLQHDIVTAAQGSYKEMYSQTACANASIASLQTQYAEYINSLSKNYVAP